MQTETPQSQPLHATPKTYVTLPPEIEEAPIFSYSYILFALVFLSVATFAGMLQSGRISLIKKAAVAAPVATPGAMAAVPAPTASSAISTIAAVVKDAPASVVKAVAHIAAPAATPVPAFSAGAFAVTSISVGSPSIAIINGASRQVGDAVDAPNVTGWTVFRIDENKVWLRNGSTISPVELSSQGLNALNDTLHPLN